MEFDELREKAVSGDMDAQYELAQKYHSGDEDVEKDIEAAIVWFTESAQQGDSASQYSLAQIFIRKHELVNARYWADQAKSNGHVFDLDDLKKLNLV